MHWRTGRNLVSPLPGIGSSWPSTFTMLPVVRFPRFRSHPSYQSPAIPAVMSTTPYRIFVGIPPSLRPRLSR
jgi:hypothetical protein